MKEIKLFAFLVFAILFLQSGFAQSVAVGGKPRPTADSKLFTFNGQLSQMEILNNQTQETLYKDKIVVSTCTQEVPYTTMECQYVTKYKTNCYTTPGHNECKTVYKTECVNETKYKKECQWIKAHQECTTSAPQKECKVVNGKLECKVIPGKKECHIVAAHQECKDVPYTETVCNPVATTECLWIPGEEICKTVPYQEYVCNEVTKYKTETYTCNKVEKVPYKTITKNYWARLDFKFDETYLTPNIDIRATLTPEGTIQFTTQDHSAKPVALLAQEERTEETNGYNTRIYVTYNIRTVDQQKLFSPVSAPANRIKFGQDILSFVVPKVFHKNLFKVKLTLKEKGTVYPQIDRQLNENEYSLVQINGQQTKIVVNLIEAGLRLNYNYYQVGIETMVKPLRTLLNSDLPPLSQTQEQIVFNNWQY